jgi:hypothetical protein
MNETGTFAVTISGAHLVVSYAIGTASQRAAWDRMWRGLLWAASSAPAATGDGA